MAKKNPAPPTTTLPPPAPAEESPKPSEAVTEGAIAVAETAPPPPPMPDDVGHVVAGDASAEHEAPADGVEKTPIEAQADGSTTELVTDGKAPGPNDPGAPFQEPSNVSPKHLSSDARDEAEAREHEEYLADKAKRELDAAVAAKLAKEGDDDSGGDDPRPAESRIPAGVRIVATPCDHDRKIGARAVGVVRWHGADIEHDTVVMLCPCFGTAEEFRELARAGAFVQPDGQPFDLDEV